MCYQLNMSSKRAEIFPAHDTNEKSLQGAAWHVKCTCGEFISDYDYFKTCESTEC